MHGLSTCPHSCPQDRRDDASAGCLVCDHCGTAGDGELERTVRKPAIDHAETRWLALRLDDDVKEIRQELRIIRTEHNERFDTIDGELQAHGGRFDSTDAVLRSLPSR